MIKLLPQNPPRLPNSNPNGHIFKNPPAFSLLDKCNNMKELQQIHAQMIKTRQSHDTFAISRIIAFCCLSEFGSLDYACQVFDKISNPNLFIWNTMIRGFARGENPQMGLFLYLQMLEGGVRANNHTFPILLKACTHAYGVREGKQIHSHMVKLGFETDIYVQNALVHLYGSCGATDDARILFEKVLERDVFTWTSIISAYVEVGLYKEALELFKEMDRTEVEPNEITMVRVVSACSEIRDLELAKWVHSCIDRKRVNCNLILWNSLIDMYAKCGSVDTARRLFDEMPERDRVSWTTMINGYAIGDRSMEAFLLFREMQMANVEPETATLLSVLLACSTLGALETGREVHDFIERKNMEMDVVLGTALVDMYAKCGDVDCAFQVYSSMKVKDVLCWTAMISGLAMNGHGERAVGLFEKMVSEGIYPDGVAFVAILCACTHAGLIEEGRRYFDSMVNVYNIRPGIEHYGCMVDLLGRGGCLVEAEELIRNMPIRPDVTVWGALLGACKIFGDVGFCERIEKSILELDYKESGIYMLLSNIYIEAGRWEDALRVRKVMMDRGIKKTPGCSWIEVNGIVHEFLVGGSHHPQSKKIYKELDDLTRRLRLAGYAPKISEMQLDPNIEEL